MPWNGRFSPFNSLDPSSYNANEVVQPSVLCSLCEPVRSWMQENCDIISLSPEEREDHSLRRTFPHYNSGRDLETSFQRGCHLCSLIWYSFTRLFGKHRHPEEIEDYWKWLRESKSFTVVCKFDRAVFGIFPYPGEPRSNSKYRYLFHPLEDCLISLSRGDLKGQLSSVSKNAAALNPITNRSSSQRPNGKSLLCLYQLSGNDAIFTAVVAKMSYPTSRMFTASL